MELELIKRRPPPGAAECWVLGHYAKDGEKTKLNSKRNELQLTGTPGAEGDTDVETTATPEARQKAAREYREKFEKFRKESETVIDGEPIPLGHRQMVKKYFELIRPSGSDTPEKPATPEQK